MVRGELLRKLFVSHKSRNEEEFKAIALEIIGEEEKKRNHQLARDLLRILENSGPSIQFPKSTNDMGTLPKNMERQTLLVDVRRPERYFSDIILTEENQRVIRRILDEYMRSELLRTHGLIAMRKILFCGPPGCGKTLCAEIISQELGLPLLYTRFDAIVSSYLGETAANLRKVFDYASSGRWVILFDEFDAIGKGRDDANEHGELKRVVNSFLQLLDSFKSESLLIAATNHEQLLDPALWRRFDEIVQFPRPSLAQIYNLLLMKLKNFPHGGLNLREQATKLKGMSHSDIERICFDAIKSCIMQDKHGIDKTAFESALQRQIERLKITKEAYKKIK